MAREHAQLSQAELAKRCGVSRGQIAKLEVGERTNPRGSDVAAVARETGVRLPWLLEEQGPMVSEGDAPETEVSSAFDGAVTWFLTVEEHEGRGDEAKAFLAQRRELFAGAEHLSPGAWLAHLQDGFRAWRSPSKVVGVRDVDPDDDEGLRPPKINARRR